MTTTELIDAVRAADPDTIGIANKGEELYYFAKRAMDIFISAIFIIAILPLYLLIAFLIKVDSPGPIFFIQDRMGSRRKKF